MSLGRLYIIMSIKKKYCACLEIWNSQFRRCGLGFQSNKLSIIWRLPKNCWTTEIEEVVNHRKRTWNDTLFRTELKVNILIPQIIAIGFVEKPIYFFTVDRIASVESLIWPVLELSWYSFKLQKPDENRHRWLLSLKRKQIRYSPINENEKNIYFWLSFPDIRP